MADRLLLVAGLLNPQQHAVVDAGDLGRPCPARDAHADLRRRALRILVPFGRNGDQLAVAVARGRLHQALPCRGGGELVQLQLVVRVLRRPHGVSHAGAPGRKTVRFRTC